MGRLVTDPASLAPGSPREMKRNPARRLESVAQGWAEGPRLEFPPRRFTFHPRLPGWHQWHG